MQRCLQHGIGALVNTTLLPPPVSLFPQLCLCLFLYTQLLLHKLPLCLLIILWPIACSIQVGRRPCFTMLQAAGVIQHKKCASITHRQPWPFPVVSNAPQAFAPQLLCCAPLPQRSQAQSPGTCSSRKPDPAAAWRQVVVVFRVTLYPELPSACNATSPCCSTRHLNTHLSVATCLLMMSFILSATCESTLNCCLSVDTWR